ncbi:AfsR/SARP family transcriptional regulator [Streptomyces sp. NPDC052309]|uniref:AfsR/SARP family transcriptional regulator n=1 Tax=Streptomyces griseicoloratus TaxID=2752516 RepID=A0A926LCM7_9ACTN|nr:AfsR/SARP family transcriptional regulator [Streptomyces griseicoloratus]MBD0424098.1 AfsR/SARP family transcriptional regulator [Streptomyces griseicoloratus]
MRFNLIGPFEIVADDGSVHLPTTPKVCQTLALLLTPPGELVTAESLVRELWGDTPPRSAPATVQTYVHQARRMLDEHGPASRGSRLLVTRPPGYVLEVDPDDVDITVFERLVTRARAALEDDRPEAAAHDLCAALALWRGPVLSNVSAGKILEGRVVYLTELRIRALELRIEAENRLGRLREAIPELRTLVHDYPLNEWFHGQLISALHRAGRRAEALEAYQNLYRILDTELGLEPSPELRRLQAELLHARGPGPAVAPLWKASFAV